MFKSTGKTLGFSRVNQSNIIDLIGIKCAQCNLIYPQDLIEEHLVTHIQPKFLMPYQENSGAKKMRSKVNLTEQTLSVRSDAIPSLNIDTFPRRQQPRKDIHAPSDFQIIVHDMPMMKRDLVSYKGDQKDLYSTMRAVVQNEQIQRLNLTQNIDLNKETTVVNMPQREARLCKSEKHVGPPGEKFMVDRKVMPFVDISEKSKEYELIVPRNKGRLIEEQQDRSLLLVNVKKHKDNTPRNDIIDTSSGKRAFQSTASRFTPTKLPQHMHKHPQHINIETSTFLGTSRSRVGHNNLQCEECHGFYCSHCKSTIPAIYRPWNIEDIDPRIVEFYKQHVYKGKCVECEKDRR